MSMKKYRLLLFVMADVLSLLAMFLCGRNFDIDPTMSMSMLFIVLAMQLRLFYNFYKGFIKFEK